MTFYEGATICLGLFAIAMYIRVKKLEDQLYRSTRCLHMVGQGKWTIKADDDEFTVFDDEGDKLMRVSRR
jgi:hypothetical protein